MSLINQGKYFGAVAPHVHVVEFQKRGLPHAHILVTLKDGYKLTTVQDINKYISAKIPDHENDSVLYNIVVQNMIHGPCDSRCIVNGKCSKHYPKEFRDETVISSDSYPYYRRQNNGRTIIRRNQVVDNRYVVPYYPGLLSRIFNSHINVEVVSSVRSVKYLYKYVYKGYDCRGVKSFDELKNVNGVQYMDYAGSCKLDDAR